ncbi:hypothetical protein JQ581_35605 [Bradyrhizobium liaoningense]|uniref:hypothetical protein n=1 Tax=Bradyrhizobium liaoningense TaxID=43992 RepID=UPI001BAB80D5|nr:hypothetical protein [Bradyrhizobium liaoningense]MBR0742276.1 hypothetical protein [Bradyrhizobium liaoningense]MBR0907612.1 hypothetical protein [Bradyrhizobium liaoningense]
MAKGKLSWRDVLPIHPAAEVVPPMSEQELRDLGDDIQKNRLHEGVALFEGQLLDGRNRLDAMELVGVSLLTGDGKINWENIPHHNVSGKDPVSFVMSKNVQRRHLSAEQKQEAIAKLLILAPEKSNRQIAATLKVDHKTVAAVRARKQSTGEIPQLRERIGRDGRRRRNPRGSPARRRVARQPAAVRVGATVDASQTPTVYAELTEAWRRASGQEREQFLKFINAAYVRDVEVVS